jgi:PadR family transcriptional regulator, regulatory protein PadR
MSDKEPIAHLYNKNTELKNMIKNQETQTKLTKNLLDLIILQVLETHPVHGYEIMTTIRKNFGVNFGASTIYPLLNTLESKKYIKSAWNMDSDRPRKVYELTADGKAMLDYTANSLKAICKTFTKNSLQTHVLPLEMQIRVASV